MESIRTLGKKLTMINLNNLMKLIAV